MSFRSKVTMPTSFGNGNNQPSQATSMKAKGETTKVSRAMPPLHPNQIASQPNESSTTMFRSSKTTESNLLHSTNTKGSSSFEQQKKGASPNFGPFQPSLLSCQSKRLVRTAHSINHQTFNAQNTSSTGPTPIINQQSLNKGYSTNNPNLDPKLINPLCPILKKRSCHGCPSEPVNATPTNEENTMKKVNITQECSASLSGLEENGVHELRKNKVSCGEKKRTYRETTGKIKWNDDIEVDVDEVVEVEETQEDGTVRVGTMEGTILARHIWHLPAERKIIVHFNEFDQPVRKAALVLMHFLSDIAKNGCYCPIGEQSWKYVDKHFKDEIISIVRERFVLPNVVNVDERMLFYVNQRWKHYRWELHHRYYRPNLTKQRLIENVPDNVIREQWIKLVSYWFSDRFQNLSEKGKRARSLQSHQRTTGSRSYAQKKIEFMKEHKREPTSLEFWKVIHERNNGGYIEGTSTQEFMDAANTKVKEYAVTSQKSLEVIENEVFNELMYGNDDTHRRVVGYGVGVTRSQVSGLKGLLNKRHFGSSSNKSAEDLNVRAQLVSMEKKSDETISLLQQRNEALEKRMESVDKHLDSLRKNNELLEKRNEELQKRNDQVFTLLTSLLEKIQKD